MWGLSDQSVNMDWPCEEHILLGCCFKTTFLLKNWEKKYNKGRVEFFNFLISKYQLLEIGCKTWKQSYHTAWSRLWAHAPLVR